MTKTKPHVPPLVRMYDWSRVREYVKRYSGPIFSYNEVVRAETIENYLVLDIKAEKMPDKIIFNGKEHKLALITR